MDEAWEGGCLCGEVRFRLRGPPKWVAWCHCQSCRRHSGAPAAVFAAFDEANIEPVKGGIAKFASSPGTRRGFCARCGSTLTCEGQARPGEVHFHIGSLDQAARLAPRFEIFPEERLPWFPSEAVAKPG